MVIFPVKVFDGKGRHKRTISAKELINRIWEQEKQGWRPSSSGIPRAKFEGLVPRDCPECGGSFKPRNAQQKICSTACKLKRESSQRRASRKRIAEEKR